MPSLTVPFLLKHKLGLAIPCIFLHSTTSKARAQHASCMALPSEAPSKGLCSLWLALCFCCPKRRVPRFAGPWASLTVRVCAPGRLESLFPRRTVTSQKVLKTNAVLVKDATWPASGLKSSFYAGVGAAQGGEPLLC